MKFTDLPIEIQLLIISGIPKNILLSTISAVSSDLHNLVKDASLWKNLGATDYDDFVAKMRALPPACRSLVFNGEFQLSDFEKNNISTILKLNWLGRVQHLIPKKYQNEGYRKNINLMVSSRGVIALCNGYITPKEALHQDVHALNLLFSKFGIIALREKLITVNQFFRLDVLLRNSLITNEGIIALREHLITPEQVEKMNQNALVLSSLLTSDGISALRENLITPEQASVMTQDQIFYLTTTIQPKCLCGREILRDKLISPDDLATLSLNQLHILTSPEGIKFLRANAEQKLITFEELIAMIDKEKSAHLSQTTLGTFFGEKKDTAIKFQQGSLTIVFEPKPSFSKSAWDLLVSNDKEEVSFIVEKESSKNAYKEFIESKNIDSLIEMLKKGGESQKKMAELLTNEIHKLRPSI